jgi:hypothetical protein
MATQSKTPRSPARPARKTKDAVPAATAPVAPPPAPATPAPKTASPKGKLGALVALLRRPEGALIPALMAETGWQAHSVRGAMSGALKKKLGLTIASEPSATGRRYRIVETPVEAGA